MWGGKLHVKVSNFQVARKHRHPQDPVHTLSVHHLPSPLDSVFSWLANSSPITDPTILELEN